MPKPTTKPASHWLSKLGDNERKFVEDNRDFEANNCVSMHEFLMRSFKFIQRELNPTVKDLLERSIPR